MMIVISWLYRDGARARIVMDELKAAGLPEADIGIIASTSSMHAENAVVEKSGEVIDRDRNAGLGAALGGAVGLIAGLGVFVLPGLGTVMAAGWLVSALAGAVAGGAAGGVVGAMIEAGISDIDAARLVEGVRRGGTLLTIRVMGKDRDFYQDILTNAFDRSGLAQPGALAKPA